LNDLARLIEREPSLTVNLLRLANSAAFSSGREVKTVAQATVMLGSRVIRNISIAHAVTALRKITDVGNFDIAAFWSDSLRRACSALVLARVAGYEDPSEAFTVGLIQDLGVLLFATSGHGDRIQTLRGLPAYERIKGEVEVTGKSHMEEFVALARAWGLPKDLVDAVSMHHSDSPGPLDRRTARLSQLARAADLIADITQTRAATDTLARARALLAQTESRAPLDLQKIVDLVAQEMVSQSRDLDIRIEQQPAFEELMDSANQALVRISLSYEQLTQRLEQLLAEKEDLAKKLATSNAALQRLATTDPLTSVGNRRLFTEALGAAVAELATGRPSTLIVLDLDHFKWINDAHGHSIGDDVLVAVATRLVAHVRVGDTIGRLGGEEFGILLPGCNRADGLIVAARLRSALRDERVRCRDGTVLEVTGSFGGVTLTQDIAADDALRIADEAMYEAKIGGRDRVIWVDPIVVSRPDAEPT